MAGNSGSSLSSLVRELPRVGRSYISLRIAHALAQSGIKSGRIELVKLPGSDVCPYCQHHRAVYYPMLGHLKFRHITFCAPCWEEERQRVIETAIAYGSPVGDATVGPDDGNSSSDDLPF